MHEILRFVVKKELKQPKNSFLLRLDSKSVQNSLKMQIPWTKY